MTYSLSDDNSPLSFDAPTPFSLLENALKSEKNLHCSGAVTGNIPSSSKGKTGENTVIKDVEDDVDEITDSDSSKTAAIIFDEIVNGNFDVLLSSNLLT